MRILALVAVLLAGSFNHAASAAITDLERQRLLAHLDMTERWLVDEVSGLSPAQLAARPAPEAWNILEVLDHLVLVGPIYWEDLQKALKTEPRALDAADRDASILWYGVDRTERQQAIPGERTQGTVRGAETALAAFRKNTAQLREFVKTTNADLRRHLVARERCDAYQWALLISTHVQRHILQIREIKAAGGFPRR